MNNHLSVWINDQLVFECDAATKLDDKQQAFLEKMERDMDRGFRMYGELITAPDTRQRATFVAMNLLKALKQGDTARTAVSCAYLNSRLPHAVEVHARDQANRIHIEFIEQH